MPDEFNLFDDDSLFPDWLQDDSDDNAGADDMSAAGGPVSGNARPAPWQSHPGSTRPSEAAPSGAAPWQQRSAQASPRTESPVGASPWQDELPASAEVPQPEAGADDMVGDLEWAMSADDEAGPPTAGDHEIPRGLTGDLPWMSPEQPQTIASGAAQDAEFDLDAETDGAQPPDAGADSGDFPDWLTFDGIEDEPDAAEQELDAPVEPVSLSERLRSVSPDAAADAAAELPDASADEGIFPDWLDDDDLFGDGDLEEVEPVSEAEPEPELEPDLDAVYEVETPAEQDEELPAWLTGEAQPPTEAFAQDYEPEGEPDADDSMPDWVGAEDVLPVVEAVESDLSYDEWEQSEIEREAEAAKTPEDRLLEEVPDWFTAGDIETEAAVPEDAAQPSGPEFVPDWFTGLEEQDIEAAPDWFQKLDYTADPMAAPAAEPAVPEAGEPGDEVPDWFKPDSLESDDDADWAKAFGAPVSMTVSGGDDEEPEELAAQEEEPADELPEPEVAELLALSDAGDEEPPVPPAVDTGAADDEDEEWMRSFEPTDAPAVPGTRHAEPVGEDFVERFEPLVPDDYATAPASEPEPALEPPAVPFDLDALGEEVALEGEMDWLQDISADALAEETASAAALEAAPPVAPEDELLAESIDSSALDDLLGISDADSALMAPGERALASDAQVFEWSDDEDLLGLGLEDADLAAVDLPDVGIEPDDLPFDHVFDGVLSGREEPPVADLPPLDAESEQPEWLAEMRPTDLPVSLSAGGAQVEMRQQDLDDLPEALRALRQQAAEPESETRFAPLDSGPLAGIDGVLPALPDSYASDMREETIGGLVITPEEQVRINRLQSILDLLAAEEEELEEDEVDFGFGVPSPFDFGEDEDIDVAEAAVAEVAATPRARRPRPYRLDRLVIMVIMLAALVVPFVTDAVHFASDPPALEGDRLAVSDAIEALVAGEYVVVAFEYGPTASGELDPLVEAVLRDVFAQGAIPLAISTSPVAALHAEAVFLPLADDPLLLKARGNGEKELVAGEDYVLLAYLPGDAVGVRRLAQTVAEPALGAEDEVRTHAVFDTDLRGEPTHLPVERVAEDVALIIVAAEDSTAVRVWAEQLEELDVPKVALVTAATEALTGPYVHADGYGGYLAGVRDTYSYNAARNATTRTAYVVPDGVSFDVPNPDESRWHSMALGAAVGAGLIALGTVVHLFRALGRRRRR